jgi:hypothetical protein
VAANPCLCFVTTAGPAAGGDSESGAADLPVNAAPDPEQHVSKASKGNCFNCYGELFSRLAEETLQARNEACTGGAAATTDQQPSIHVSLRLHDPPLPNPIGSAWAADPAHMEVPANFTAGTG